VHKLIFDLRPSLLDDLGLVAALRWYAESRMQAAGVDVSVEISGEERRLLPEVETALFRALQEAITNIAKHAEAETAVVRLEFRDDLVVAEVEDDGVGFDPAAATPEAGKMQGLGLLGMKERIGILQGRMSVVSRPGNGTRIRFELPIVLGGEHYETNSCALSG
jgi:signal transduction histidine kinase